MYAIRPGLIFLEDIRLSESKANAQQRSINLAISSRGIAALHAVLGPAATDRFLETVIPMRARMIHREDGKLDSQTYDRHGQVRCRPAPSGIAEARANYRLGNTSGHERPSHFDCGSIAASMLLLIILARPRQYLTCFPAQCINSIDRALLNESILDETLANPHVRAFFKHKITAIDFENRSMGVHDVDGRKDIRVAFDLCIGADGSYSVVRRQMMRAVR